MKKLLLPLLAVCIVSSAFAEEKPASQLIAVAPQCISFNSPISFVAKGALIDSNRIEAGVNGSSIENLSNSAIVRNNGDYSNKWNTAVSDATLALKKSSNGDLKATVVLTELRKAVANLEFQQKYEDAAASVCVTSVALSVNHGDDKLVGGTMELYLNTGEFITLDL
jgi:hypothetical protein